MERVAANQPPVLMACDCAPNYIDGVTFYFVHGPAGLPMSNVYCTDPDDAYDALSVRPTHFDIMRLPAHCRDHALLLAEYTGETEADLEAFNRQRLGVHCEIIMRALYSGVPLGSAAEAKRATHSMRVREMNRGLRLVRA